MKKWLKRIRGAVGMGLTWGAAWFGVGAILQPVTAGAIVMVELFLGGLGFAMMGFIGGAAFSVVLGIAEGRRRFDEMSLPRFAGWGAVGGFLIMVLVWVVITSGLRVTLPFVLVAGVVGALGALMGAGSAAGSLALARKADDRELLEHGADVADIGLTEEEKRELLTG